MTRDWDYESKDFLGKFRIDRMKKGDCSDAKRELNFHGNAFFTDSHVSFNTWWTSGGEPGFIQKLLKTVRYTPVLYVGDYNKLYVESRFQANCWSIYQRLASMDEKDDIKDLPIFDPS